jgi:hypothetical protein
MSKISEMAAVVTPATSDYFPVIQGGANKRETIAQLLGLLSSANVLSALGSQSINTVLAGPASGSAGASAFRALVPADIPSSLPVNKLAAQTASRLPVFDGSGFLAPSAVTSTEAGYLSGVTSAIQTQLDAKAATSALDAYTPTADLGDTYYTEDEIDTLIADYYTSAQVDTLLEGYTATADLGVLATRDDVGNAQVAADAAIAYSKLALTGAVLDADIVALAASKLTGALPAISGAALTALNASNLGSGTVPDARFPATLPAASGVNLTALNASNLGSGTVPDARFPATLPALNGSALTALNAANLGSGTIPDARFPATLPALNGSALTALNAANIASGVLATARGGLGVALSDPGLDKLVGWDESANAHIYFGLGAGLQFNGTDIEATGGGGGAGALNDLDDVDLGTPADGEAFIFNGTDWVNREIVAADISDTLAWAQVSKTGSSLADLATRSAADLSSGTLPDARFPATLPAASGVNLTALNATNLGSGTVPDARFPATLPAASGVNLTALNATNLGSGTVPDARFPATLPALNGSALTALNATNISSGSLALARITALTASRVVIANASGVLEAHGSVSDTELGYLDGVTSAIQTQLDAKATKSGRPFVTLQPEGVSFPATNAASPDTRLGTSTPAETVSVLDFDDTSVEYLDWKVVLPSAYSGGGLTLDIWWAATSATSGAVVWSVAVRAFPSDAEDMDGSHTYSYKDASAATTASAAGELIKTTIALSHGAEMDNWAAGEMGIIRLRRLPTDGGDTMVGDAEVALVSVRES